MKLRKGGKRIVILLMFALSGYTIVNLLSIRVQLLLVVVLLVLGSVLRFDYRHSDATVVISLISIAGLIPQMILNINNISYCLVIILTVLSAYGISREFSKQEFAKNVVNVMIGISAISILGYVLVNVLGIPISLFELVNPSNQSRYEVSIVFNYMKGEPLRNCGIFWEPGLMASFTIIALILNRLFDIHNHIWHKIILCSALLLTLSSAGIVLFVFYILFEFLYARNNTNLSKLGYFILIIMLSALVYLALASESMLAMNSLVSNAFEKLQWKTVVSSQRVKAIEYWFNTFTSHPLFGVGISEISETFVWDTCTSFLFLGAFGIGGAIYTIGWIRGVMKCQWVSFGARLVIGAAFLVIINKEPHAHLLLSWALMLVLNKDGYKELRYKSI